MNLSSLLPFALRAVRASIPGAVCSSAATLGTAAACGLIENRNALAPINDIAHVFYGQEAFGAGASTWGARNLLRYTLPAMAWNTFALVGWALLHRFLAGRNRPGKPTGKPPSRARSLAAGAAVALVAYVVDYKLVSPRWTPGIEAHLSGRSLFAVYVALALGLALAPGRGE